MPLPPSAEGYAIDRATLTVHRRYAAHASGAHRTSALGIAGMAGGRTVLHCELCFPPPAASKAWRPPKPVPAIEPESPAEDDDEPGTIVTSGDIE